MKKEDLKKAKAGGKEELPGYPLYPDEEDIYVRGKKESLIDPENIKEVKVPVEITGKKNTKDFRDDKSGSDLDIPGSELDDIREDVGSEDEENNFYSLGRFKNQDSDSE